MSPANNLVQIAIGLISTFVVGLFVKGVLNQTKKSIQLEPPIATLKAQWERVVAGDGTGLWLGYLERFLFFFAFYSSASYVITGWLAFKLASKWHVWTHVVAVPKEIPGLDPLDYLIARRRWASRLLATFLVGTLWNVIAGFLGALVARNAYAFLCLPG